MQKLVIGKRSRVCLLVFAVIISLFLSGCIGAGFSPSASSGVNVSGTWNLFLSTSSAVSTPVIFIQVGNSLTVNGTANAGTVNGQSITFSLLQSDGSTAAYNGTVNSDATTMSGSFTSTTGAGGSWNATLAVATVNISGTWNVFHTPTNSTLQGPDVFIFTQTNSTLSGTTKLSNQPVTGIVSGLTIQFTWIGTDGATNIYIGTISSTGTSMGGIYTTGSVQAGNWNATQTSSSTTVDITGTWNVFQKLSSATSETALGIFTFNQGSTGAVTGTAPQGEQINGNVTGQNITFSWTGTDGSVNSYTGSVLSNGNSMQGTFTITANSIQTSGTWRATPSG